jgi:hypothetical protein
MMPRLNLGHPLKSLKKNVEIVVMRHYSTTFVVNSS